MTLLVVGAAPTFVTSAALAQSASDAPFPPPGAVHEETAPSPALAEVVVTALKRRQSVQQVAAAVTAIDGETLRQASVVDLRGVQALVPGARFQQEGNSTQVFLRGVGSNLDYGNIEQSVSFAFDGVYIPREGTSVPLFDVERVEVLPGPQGTLYGRSAIGGAVNVAFQRPTARLEGIGLIEFGNYSLSHGTLVENLPLGTDLSVRAAIDYTRRDGFMESGADSANDVAGRLSLLYRPVKALNIYVWGLAVNKSGSPPNLVNKGETPGDHYQENAFLRPSAWDDLRPGALEPLAVFGQPRAPAQAFNNFALGAQIEATVGGGMTVTEIPSIYYVNAATRDYWLGAIPASESAHYHQLTNELRLAGTERRVDWLVGIYAYQTLNGGLAQVLIDTPLVFDVSHVIRNELKGAAIFGQGVYHLGDHLRVTVGGRFSLDQRDAHGLSPLDGAAYSFHKTFRHADEKFGVEYDVASGIMSYGTYQTGYQPGTYNEIASTTVVSNFVKPEVLSSFSGGLKSISENGRVKINVEAFYYDYRNIFIQSYDTSKAYNPIFSARRVTIPGAQIDISSRVRDADQIKGSVSYAKARNIDFVTPAGQDYDGLSPPYASDWTASLGFVHDFETRAGRLRAEGDARYESEFYADFIHHPGVEQAAVVKENASLTFSPSGQPWTFAVWVKNISNVAAIAAAAAAGIPGPATAYLEPPRTFGARATMRY